MVGAVLYDRHYPILRSRRPRWLAQLCQILQSAFRSYPNPRRDHRESVPSWTRRAGRAAVSWRDLSRELLRRVTVAVAEPCAVWVAVY